FQAEDGIRDFHVTGVQTCALPISATTIDDAVEVHATYRIQMVIRGAEGMLTDVQASLGELMADYLLVQRGIAEDIRRAERERGQIGRASCRGRGEIEGDAGGVEEK